VRICKEIRNSLALIKWANRFSSDGVELDRTMPHSVKANTRNIELYSDRPRPLNDRGHVEAASVRRGSGVSVESAAGSRNVSSQQQFDGSERYREKDSDEENIRSGLVSDLEANDDHNPASENRDEKVGDGGNDDDVDDYEAIFAPLIGPEQNYWARKSYLEAEYKLRTLLATAHLVDEYCSGNYLYAGIPSTERQNKLTDNSHKAVHSPQPIHRNEADGLSTVNQQHSSTLGSGISSSVPGAALTVPDAASDNQIPRFKLIPRLSDQELLNLLGVRVIDENDSSRINGANIAEDEKDTEHHQELLNNTRLNSHRSTGSGSVSHQSISLSVRSSAREGSLRSATSSQQTTSRQITASSTTTRQTRATGLANSNKRNANNRRTMSTSAMIGLVQDDDYSQTSASQASNNSSNRTPASRLPSLHSIDDDADNQLVSMPIRVVLKSSSRRNMSNDSSFGKFSPSSRSVLDGPGKFIGSQPGGGIGGLSSLAGAQFITAASNTTVTTMTNIAISGGNERRSVTESSNMQRRQYQLKTGHGYDAAHGIANTGSAGVNVASGLGRTGGYGSSSYSDTHGSDVSSVKSGQSQSVHSINSLRQQQRLSHQEQRMPLSKMNRQQSQEIQELKLQQTQYQQQQMKGPTLLSSVPSILAPTVPQNGTAGMLAQVPSQAATKSSAIEQIAHTQLFPIQRRNQIGSSNNFMNPAHLKQLQQQQLQQQQLQQQQQQQQLHLQQQQRQLQARQQQLHLQHQQHLELQRQQQPVLKQQMVLPNQHQHLPPNHVQITQTVVQKGQSSLGLPPLPLNQLAAQQVYMQKQSAPNTAATSITAEMTATPASMVPGGSNSYKYTYDYNYDGDDYVYDHEANAQQLQLQQHLVLQQKLLDLQSHQQQQQQQIAVEGNGVVSQQMIRLQQPASDGNQMGIQRRISVFSTDSRDDQGVLEQAAMTGDGDVDFGYGYDDPFASDDNTVNSASIRADNGVGASGVGNVQTVHYSYNYCYDGEGTEMIRSVVNSTVNVGANTTVDRVLHIGELYADSGATVVGSNIDQDYRQGSHNDSGIHQSSSLQPFGHGQGNLQQVQHLPAAVSAAGVHQKRVNISEQTNSVRQYAFDYNQYEDPHGQINNRYSYGNDNTGRQQGYEDDNYNADNDGGDDDEGESDEDEYGSFAGNVRSKRSGGSAYSVHDPYQYSGYDEEELTVVSVAASQAIWIIEPTEFNELLTSRPLDPITATIAPPTDANFNPNANPLTAVASSIVNDAIIHNMKSLQSARSDRDRDRDAQSIGTYEEEDNYSAFYSQCDFTVVSEESKNVKVVSLTAVDGNVKNLSGQEAASAVAAKKEEERINTAYARSLVNATLLQFRSVGFAGRPDVSELLLNATELGSHMLSSRYLLDQLSVDISTIQDVFKLILGEVETDTLNNNILTVIDHVTVIEVLITKVELLFKCTRNESTELIWHIPADESDVPELPGIFR
jgi:hypothetical protein